MAFLLLHSAKIDLAAGDLPTRLVVLPWGKNATVSAGDVSVNATTLATLAANQATMKFDRVALDFNHNTVAGSQWYKGEPAKVAAFASPTVIEGEGLVFTDIDWTADGREHVTGKHYIDLSAAVKTDKDGAVIFCHSAAVCRQGQVRGLHILATDPFETLTQPVNTMDLEALKALLVTLVAAFHPGISEESTDAEIEAAVKKIAESQSEDNSSEEEITALSAKVTALETAIAAAGEAGDLKVLSAKYDSRLDALEQRNDTLAREAIRTQALRDGKLIPLSASDLTFAQFSRLVGELPAGQVPLDQRTPEGIKALSSSGVISRDNSDDEVRKRLKLTPEQWAKHNA